MIIIKVRTNVLYLNNIAKEIKVTDVVEISDIRPLILSIFSGAWTNYTQNKSEHSWRLAKDREVALLIVQKPWTKNMLAARL